MGELTFFLGLQVKQKQNGIFISQDKYVGEILKKFGLFSIRSASTPMETHKALTKDEDGEDVDVHLYRSMIGSLMYLTSSRPDIMFLCKKHTVVANSTTEAEYIDASHCYDQVLWIQNQMLDYGYNFMQTKIHVGNKSAIYHNVVDLLTKAFDTSKQIKRGWDTMIPQSSGPPNKVGYEAVHKELGDIMERTATTASSLEAEQDSGNIN
ncbi:hypothetical protein Tco_0084835 [Tanacetum coccineum]